jgi:hypothetical protein
MGEKKSLGGEEMTDDEWPHKHKWKLVKMFGTEETAFYQCSECGIVSKKGRFKK